MKKFFAIFVATFFLSAQFGMCKDVPSFFDSVSVYNDTWEVTFSGNGSRYHIMIDDYDRGTSGYFQRLLLKRSERLRLTDKHSSITVVPSTRDGKSGVEITITYTDRFSGQQKQKVMFEKSI